MLSRPLAADLNNCYCADGASDLSDFEGDVQFLLDAELDGVKIDGCGRLPCTISLASAFFSR